MEHWATIAAERRALADQLDSLSPEQWATPSLCDAWTVREVAAHLVVPHVAGLPTFLLTLLRAKGSFEKANQAMATREAARPTAEIVADLRKHAEGRFAPPGFGSIAPLTDALVHAEDIRIPLGLPDDRPNAPWQAVLEFIVSPKARRGFAPKTIPPLHYTATDLEWSFGTGDDVAGPARALALTLLRRPARLGELTGPGVQTLQDWLR